MALLQTNHAQLLVIQHVLELEIGGSNIELKWSIFVISCVELYTRWYERFYNEGVIHFLSSIALLKT